MENPKSQALNPKEIPNPNVQNPRRYDLEDRTFAFANRISGFIDKLHKTMSNVQYIKQLIRSSSSVGANYIEANEAISRKDFLLRIKICRKEAKETIFWLRLLQLNSSEHENERVVFIREAIELCKIFGSIITK